MGVSNIELVGKTTYDITDEKLADAYQKKDIEVLESLGSQSYEEVVLYADGSLRNIILNKAIFTDDNGAPIGIVGVMTDITDKIEAGKLKQSINEILEIDKKKTEFLANISHELRTPLNVIFGSVQLMELYLSDNVYANSKGKFIKNIAITKQNCYRLLRLVNNIIDTSKIDAKAFGLHLKNCNIVSVVEEITLSVSDYTESKGINLVFDTDKEEIVMACDDEKIERILLNLLSNAIKFTPKGGEISVNIHYNDNSLCIKVEDNGIGIPEDKQSQIFQRFCQIDELLTRQHEGSGIGLSLVKSLVEMHGGTIEFESKIGIGTSFIINLPYKKVEDEKEQYNTYAKQTHIEKINVEFSDIYSIGS
jgi:signal transduction histidine kinase